MQKLCMPVIPPCLVHCALLRGRSEKFEPNPFGGFWEKLIKLKDAYFMHDSANLCKTMYHRV